MEDVCWLGAGSLHRAAPSRGWLPRGGSSLLRSYNLPSSKNITSLLRRTPLFFKERSLLRRTPHLRSSKPKMEERFAFDLRTRRSKNIPSSIFDLRSRRSKTFHLRSSQTMIDEPPPSSIFGTENRIIPYFNDRSAEPKTEQPCRLRSRL